MSLKDRESGRVYTDNQRLSITKWAELFGIKRESFQEAAIRGGVHIEARRPSEGGRAIRSIAIGEFPKVMNGFVVGHAQGRARVITQPWATVDTSQAIFEVKPPSGRPLQFTKESE